MKYSEWLEQVPPTLKDDAVWKLAAYRHSLFLAELAWHDVSRLYRDPRTVGLAGQLYDAIGSIGANLAEGYSRGSGRDRAKFYEYSLGSARESRNWYFKARHLLGKDVTGHRLELIANIIRLTLTMIPDQRGSALHEEPAPYGSEHPSTPPTNSESLLETIPMPA
jgi:four helix bundle protein